MVAALLILLSALALGFVMVWVAAVREARTPGTAPPEASPGLPTAEHHAVGLVTNFFDTLGIGSFAPTTVIFRLRRLVPDDLMPGTLNVGHSLPVTVQALIYIGIIAVDPWTLVLLIAAAAAGAWFGAGVVAGLSRRRIQMGMGGALLAAASLMVMTQFGWFPGGGDTLGLEGPRLAIGIGGAAVAGALMTLGVGFYAPCMILVSLLGMNPTAAFPIMMGACAFMMPVASMRFVRKQRYSLRPALGLTMGGIPGVLLAAFIVRSLDLATVRWLVVVVVLYTAVSMLVAATAPRLRSDAP
ncbi:UPF0721 transmembrane protein [Luteitalea sp. TBR-22]|uniref:TSUP family transporter n=1 Tax=Luteitalea sp. TBR-22 TaxID=2802971 RepID=UPI001AF7B49D|nr:TSUP family transporter [Luteitalea sp. TBR-22]BCS32964.1 UPF0721 transmembrane protein [Luteitalea sp. TBR-22]